MLFGGHELQFGGGALRYRIGLAGSLRFYSLVRNDLVFDSRFVAPLEEPPRAYSAFYALLRGGLHWHEPHEERIFGPALLRVNGTQLEGASGRHERTYSNGGSPLDLVVLWLPDDLCVAPPVAEPFRIDAPQSLFEALRTYLARSIEAKVNANMVPAARNVLTEFIGAGLLHLDAFEELERALSSSTQRLWRGLREVWTGSRSLPSLSQLASETGVSERQLKRDFQGASSMLATPGIRWRRAMLDWRFRLAVTLLSAPTATVVEVAKYVGYGSADALARAFREAGRPAPTAVRAALLEEQKLYAVHT